MHAMLHPYRVCLQTSVQHIHPVNGRQPCLVFAHGRLGRVQSLNRQLALQAECILFASVCALPQFALLWISLISTQNWIMFHHPIHQPSFGRLAPILFVQNCNVGEGRASSQHIGCLALDTYEQSSPSDEVRGHWSTKCLELVGIPIFRGHSSPYLLRLFSCGIPPKK